LSKQALHLDIDRWHKARELFSSLGVDDATTCTVIADVQKRTGFLIDPHTAVGVEAARVCNQDKSVPMITLATAHPVKFADAVTRAGLESPALPAHLQDLFEREERYEVLDNSVDEVTRFLRSKL
ncbi:MAG: threonine synthase, partial [Pseudohongiella sp.]|nr:threonine synthase [Pseudohongiella sp.]